MYDTFLQKLEKYKERKRETKEREESLKYIPHTYYIYFRSLKKSKKKYNFSSFYLKLLEIKLRHIHYTLVKNTLINSYIITQVCNCIFMLHKPYYKWMILTPLQIFYYKCQKKKMNKTRNFILF